MQIVWPDMNCLMRVGFLQITPPHFLCCFFLNGQAALRRRDVCKAKLFFMSERHPKKTVLGCDMIFISTSSYRRCHVSHVMSPQSLTSDRPDKNILFYFSQKSQQLSLTLKQCISFNQNFHQLFQGDGDKVKERQSFAAFSISTESVIQTRIVFG